MSITRPLPYPRFKTYKILHDHENEFGPGTFIKKEIHQMDDKEAYVPNGFSLVVLDSGFASARPLRIIGLDIDETLLDYIKSVAKDQAEPVLHFSKEFAAMLKEAVEKNVLIVIVTKRILFEQNSIYKSVDVLSVIQKLEDNIYKDFGVKIRPISAIFFTDNHSKFFPLKYLSETYSLPPSHLILVDDSSEQLRLANILFNICNIKGKDPFKEIITPFLDFLEDKSIASLPLKESKLISVDDVKSDIEKYAQMFHHPLGEQRLIGLLQSTLLNKQFKELAMLQTLLAPTIFWRAMFAAIDKLELMSSKFKALEIVNDENFIKFIAKQLDHLIETCDLYTTLCQIVMFYQLMPSIFDKIFSEKLVTHEYLTKLPSVQMAIKLIQDDASADAVHQFFICGRKIMRALEKSQDEATLIFVEKILFQLSPEMVQTVLQYSDTSKSLEECPEILLVCRRLGNIEAFKAALAKGADPHFEDPFYNPPLRFLDSLIFSYLESPSPEALEYVKVLVNSKQLELKSAPGAVSAMALFEKMQKCSDLLQEAVLKLFMAAVRRPTISPELVKLYQDFIRFTRLLHLLKLPNDKGTRERELHRIYTQLTDEEMSLRLWRKDISGVKEIEADLYKEFRFLNTQIKKDFQKMKAGMVEAKLDLKFFRVNRLNALIKRFETHLKVMDEITSQEKEALALAPQRLFSPAPSVTLSIALKKEVDTKPVNGVRPA